MAFNPTSIVPIFWSYDVPGSELAHSSEASILAFQLRDRIPIQVNVAVTYKLWNVILFAGEVVVVTERIALKTIRKLATETVTISESLVKHKRYPRTMSETTSIAELLKRKAQPKPPTQNVSITEGSGYTSGFTAGYEAIQGLLRTAKPKIATETVTVTSGTLLRKVTRKIATETVTIGEALVRVKGRFYTLTENITVSDSLARVAKHFRTFTETTSITESKVRKAMPKIAVETVSKAESLLRKPMPKLALQTVTIVESLSRFAHFFRSLTESKAITELLTRKALPKVATQTTSISETLTRKPKPKIATETVSISDSIAKVKRYIRTITEAGITISESIKRKISRLISQVTTIADSLFAQKGGGPKLITVTDTVAVSDSIKRLVRRPLLESRSISDSLLRKPIRNLVDPLVAAFYDVLYIYPNWYVGTPYGWTPIINAAAANPTVKFFVVINVNSGPDVAINTDYTHGIADLQAQSNITILGYVATQYGAKTLSAVEGEIDNWASFYPTINGIMLDEMDNVTGHESYYSSITAYAHSHSGVNFRYVFANPGNPTITSYVGTVDVIIIFENVGPPPTESTLQTRTFNRAYSPNMFAMVVHDQATDPGRDYTIMASQYVGYIMYTDGTGTNPYNIVPSYINSEILDFYPNYVIKDSLLRKVIRKLLQTVTVSESLARFAHFFRAITETRSITESLLRKARPLLATQSSSITESLKRLVKPKINTETVTISDSIAKVKRYIRAISEPAITVAESIKRKVSRKLLEVITIVESLSASKGGRTNFTLTETIPISESLVRHAHFFRSLTDVTVLSDSIKRAYRHTLSEVITATGTVARKATRFRSLSDSVTLTGTVARIKGRFVTLTETIAVTDSLSRLAKHFRTITQATTITDFLQSSKNKIKEISLFETVNVSDSLSIKTYIQKVVRSVGGIGGGFAASGERTNRPVPLRDYKSRYENLGMFVKDWTMPWRRNISKKKGKP